MRMESQLSVINDWTRPIEPASFALRGSIPGMSARFGDVVEFTSLGFSVNVGLQRNIFPPYNQHALWGPGFFGTCRLRTPNDIMKLAMSFSLSEYDGFLNLILAAESTVSDFFGIKGLYLSDIAFTTSFVIGAVPTSLAFNASALLELSPIILVLSGSYTKETWYFAADLRDFDFL